MARQFLLFRLFSFRRNAGGASAVEFALLFPVMMVMLLGSVGVGQAISLNRKITLLSRSIADIVSQSDKVTNSELNGIFAASRTILTPYNTAPVQMMIASIWTDGSGNSTVDWSYAQNASTLGKGSSYAVPTDMKINNSGLILARVRYPYTVPFGQAIIGNSITLQEESLMKPRLVDRIPEPAS
jgi:Flp pilus assembly protein TadG